MIALISERASSCHCADGFDMGDFVSDEQFKRVTGYLEAGRQQGAKMVTGGSRVGDQGYFVQPTVLTETKPEKSVELRGKSPDIVFADADLETAVPGAGMAVFANSGQICSAGTRLFVERKVYDEFVGRVADFGKGLRVGNGIDLDTQIVRAAARARHRLPQHRSPGGRSRHRWGRAVDGRTFREGLFVPSTVFADVCDDMRIA